MALQLHPAIYDFDRQLRIASRLLAEQTTDAPEEVTPDSTSEESAYDQVLFDKLRAWRLERARTEKVAPFMIAHDSALQELARRKPVTPQKLLATKGFGPQKAETYGPDILKIMHEYTGTESATTSAWTERDNAELLKQFKSGMPLLALTKQFGATPEELWSHLSDLLNQ
jgi:ribonuclease D